MLCSNFWSSILCIYDICAGVEVSTEDIKHAVNEVFEENKASILELRYRTNGICTISPSNGFNNYDVCFCLKF